MSDARPIGIFDSGLGGLTVFKQIAKLMPRENLIYLGDNARVPYGGRSKEVVTKFSFENASFLITKKVKCIVIACNTSSALAGNDLKRKIKVPVFDVITPAIKEARKVSKTGKIGVIGTRGTIGSGAYDVPYKESCPLFVPFIEEGESKSPALKIIAKKYLAPLKKAKIDTLIMGCTHYPIIRDVIESEIDHHKVVLIDPGVAQARDVFEYLSENKLLNLQKKTGKHEFFVTDLTERFKKVAEMFLGHSIKENLKKVVIDQ